MFAPGAPWQMASSRTLLLTVLALCLIGVLLLPPRLTEPLRMQVLAEPTAALAAGVLQCPRWRDAATGWPILATPHGTLRVTPACSGMTFLAIALMVACTHLLPQAGPWLRRLGPLLLALGLAYGLTLLLNAARLLAVAGTVPAMRHLPPAASDLLHLGVGVLVFLPGLIAFSILLAQWRRCHGCEPHA